MLPAARPLAVLVQLSLSLLGRAEAELLKLKGMEPLVEYIKVRTPIRLCISC